MRRLRRRMTTRTEIEERLRLARADWLTAVHDEDRKAEHEAMKRLDDALKDLQYLLHPDR